MRGLTNVVRDELSARDRGPDDRATGVFELRRQLARERARNAGLEHGISALDARVRGLSAELAELRAQ
jgi:hypothetical protein